MLCSTFDPALPGDTQACNVCAHVSGLYGKVCLAVNTAYRLRFYKHSPQAQQQCTTASYTEWASGVSIQIVFAPATSKTPTKNTRTHTRIYSLTNAAWHHACTVRTHSHAFKDTSRGNIQTGMHNKGKSLWAPQLISCMEIIFKTEQNGGPSLSGRVGLRRAPGAGWHVTVYACFLNKRC